MRGIHNHNLANTAFIMDSIAPLFHHGAWERSMAELSIRIDYGPGRRLGPGKIELLEQIASHGSIAAGGRALGMSYRRAWELVDEINKIFEQPVLVPKAGGKKRWRGSTHPARAGSDHALPCDRAGCVRRGFSATGCSQR